MSIRTWDSLWDGLAARFEILALDLPGFGLSGSRPELLRPTALGEFLAKAIEHFSWQGCLAVDPDVGVPVLLALAERRPELLRGIAIGDGPGYYPPRLSFDLSFSTRSSVFRAVAIASYEPRVYLKQVFWRARRKRPLDPDAYRECLKVNSRAGFRNTMAFLSSYPEDLKAIGSGLGRIRLPALVFWGDRDRFVPLENGEALAKALPNARLHIFAGCGHFSHEDAGPEFVSTLVSWAGSL